MTKRCNTCGGEYPDKQADGTESYHACAPRVFARVRNPDGTTAVVLASDAAGREVITTQTVERQQKRDENVKRRKLGDAREIIAAGNGYTQV